MYSCTVRDTKYPTKFEASTKNCITMILRMWYKTLDSMTCKTRTVSKSEVRWHPKLKISSKSPSKHSYSPHMVMSCVLSYMCPSAKSRIYFCIPFITDVYIYIILYIINSSPKQNRRCSPLEETLNWT